MNVFRLTLIGVTMMLAILSLLGNLNPPETSLGLLNNVVSCWILIGAAALNFAAFIVSLDKQGKYKGLANRLTFVSIWPVLIIVGAPYLVTFIKEG